MLTKESIEQYFRLLKNEQLFLMSLGGIALVIALVFYFYLKTDWYKGFALPLAVFALLFCGAGFNNYGKIAALRVRSVYNYDLHPELLKTKELPRVKKQQQDLQVLIYVNISIIVAAFLIFLYFRKKAQNEYYMGAAASLFLSASVSVIIYLFMLSHSKGYITGIEKFTEKIIVNTTG